MTVVMRFVMEFMNVKKSLVEIDFLIDPLKLVTDCFDNLLEPVTNHILTD